LRTGFSSGCPLRLCFRRPDHRTTTVREPGSFPPAGHVICQPNILVANTPFPTSSTTFGTDSNGGQPQGMVLGPDNYLYVCEPQNGRIVRFIATNPTPSTPVSSATVFTYSGTGPKEPQCGHFTWTGDLIVSDEASGSGVWEFQNTAAPSISVPLSLSSTPTNVLGICRQCQRLPLHCAL
jgi:hypothetical protein